MTKKVAIIFVSLVVLLAIGVGVYLSLGKKVPVSHQAPAKKLTEIRVASWKTYQNKDFSFKYPADWKIATSEAKLSIGTFKTEIITNVTLPTVLLSGSTSATLTIPPEGGTITIQDAPTATSAASQFPSTFYAPAAKLQIGNIEVQTYKPKQQGAAINYLIIPYKQYTVSLNYYNYQHPDWDYPTLFDQIIKSFK